MQVLFVHLLDESKNNKLRYKIINFHLKTGIIKQISIVMKILLGFFWFELYKYCV